MGYISKILSGGAKAAGKAGKGATKTTRRKFLTGVGTAAAGGLALDELANDGDVRKGAVETGGNWWEEIVEDPMGLNIDSVNEYNEAVNEFEENFEDQYLSEHHQARATDDVGRMPSDLNAGDTLDDEQYAALGFNSEDINNSDGESLIGRTVDDDEFTVLTPDGVRMADGDFGDEVGAIAINDDQNEFDVSELEQMRDAYQRAANISSTWMTRVNELQTEGESLDRLSKEYEDEEEIPAVQQAREHQEYLSNVQNNIATDQLRFRAQANLFDHAIQNSPFSDGEDVGVDYEEEGTETGNGDDGSSSENYGEHNTYGDVPEYCDFEDETINDIHGYMDENNINSYDEFDIDISSTNGDFTVEFTYEGDTISVDNVEGCGA